LGVTAMTPMDPLVGRFAPIASMDFLPEVVMILVGTGNGGETEGLDLWVLGGSAVLFLAIVVAITLLRRWR
jgi:hypothetical protein